MNKIRLLIVDDQALMRDGLKTVLEHEKDIEVVGTGKSGLEAVNLAKLHKPDVMLLDIRMPEMNGVEAVRLIKEKCPDTKVIMLTTFNDDEYIIEALANGASGYLLKDIEIEKLIATVHDAVEGRVIMPSEVASKLAEGLAKLQLKKKENYSREELGFSEREKEIASMMVQGFTNKQIASALFISEGTVRNYISSIYSKINIGDRTQAVLYLKEMGVN